MITVLRWKKNGNKRLDLSVRESKKQEFFLSSCLPSVVKGEKMWSQMGMEAMLIQGNITDAFLRN